ncbi:MAG: phosphatidylserine decarboxylase [Candidatus Puniceispirillaceae bacterium]
MTEKQTKSPQARFQEIGFSTKAVMGALVVIATLFSVGLGFVAFGLFLYLHLLLQIKHRPPLGAKGDIAAPVDGVIHNITKHENSIIIEIRADKAGSQVFYAPLTARLDDKLFIDGVYLPLHDEAAQPLNARFDLLFQTTDMPDDKAGQITMSVIGSQWSRLTQIPFMEGQMIEAGEPFGFSLFQSCIILQLPPDYKIMVMPKTHCLANQTIIAKSAI